MAKVKLDKKKWIEIVMRIDVSSTGLVRRKAAIKALSEELSDPWVVDVDKEGYVGEEGVRWYPIMFHPKNDKISPESYRKDYEKLQGYAMHTYRDMIAQLTEEEANETSFYRFQWDYAKETPDPEKVYVYERFGYLNVKYRMVDVIDFENAYPDFAKAIFNDFVVQKLDESIKTFSFFEKIFDKDTRELAKKECSKLQEYFGFEIER